MAGAGDIEREGEIVGSSGDIAERLRDIAQSIRMTLEFAEAAAEAGARRLPKAPDPGSSAMPSTIYFLLTARKEARHTGE
jgi:hypothetical protein